MKKLLLNLLLVFGSAFIYIQCVKLLTTNKTSKHQLYDHAKIDDATPDKQNKTIAPSVNKSTNSLNFKNKAILPVFSNAAFPRSIVLYMNYHSLFYDPYPGLSYYDLLSKYKDESQFSK